MHHSCPFPVILGSWKDTMALSESSSHPICILLFRAWSTVSLEEGLPHIYSALCVIHPVHAAWFLWAKTVAMPCLWQMMFSHASPWAHHLGGYRSILQTAKPWMSDDLLLEGVKATSHSCGYGLGIIRHPHIIYFARIMVERVLEPQLISLPCHKWAAWLSCFHSSLDLLSIWLGQKLDRAPNILWLEFSIKPMLLDGISLILLPSLSKIYPACVVYSDSFDMQHNTFEYMSAITNTPCTASINAFQGSA